MGLPLRSGWSFVPPAGRKVGQVSDRMEAVAGPNQQKSDFASREAQVSYGFFRKLPLGGWEKIEKR